MENNNNNNQKFIKHKWEVLEKMSWRNNDFEPGQIIEDTDNTYMRAMQHQGKCKKIS